MRIIWNYLFVIFFVGLNVFGEENVMAQSKAKRKVSTFVHPGMMQRLEDLDYMRSMILEGHRPWKDAYTRLLENTSLEFDPNPVSCISVGAYRANSIGRKQFYEGAKTAYNAALIWYVTKDEKYAWKAIEIINAWSYHLWSLDGNNAKLNIGLAGSYYLNAAEIIKYTYTKWDEKDQEQFKRMLLTVFYPTIKDFFSEANGNWDGSMINTMMCIGVFLDDTNMYNSAVDRYFYGEGNSGITKYIWPGGQCQETTRDWEHVQLGIGEFVKAAQLARTQGIDFYSEANDRLARGFEYASKFLLGNEVDLYGPMSYRKTENHRDIYEFIVYYYANSKGIDLPYTRELIEKFTRENSSLTMLTAFTAPEKEKVSLQVLEPETFLSSTTTGALAEATIPAPAEAIRVNPGSSIQEAIEKAMKTSEKWVVLEKGIHRINSTIWVESGLTLSGEGRESVLMMADDVTGLAIGCQDKNLHNLTIRDLFIEGGTVTGSLFDPNYERQKRAWNMALSREGIKFLADTIGQIQNIHFENVTLQGFTKNGISIDGTKNVSIHSCNITDNGAHVVPGPGFHHNLKLSHAVDCQIEESRFDMSLFGAGIDCTFSNRISITACETARNKLSGIRIADSDTITIEGVRSEGNDLDGIEVEQLMDAPAAIILRNNLTQNNGRKGVWIDENCIVKTVGNIVIHNRND